MKVLRWALLGLVAAAVATLVVELLVPRRRRVGTDYLAPRPASDWRAVLPAPPA